MGYESLRLQLDVLETHVAKLRIKTSSEATMITQIASVREFLNDLNDPSIKDVDLKWGPRFKEFYDSQLAVKMLSEAVSELLTNQEPQLTTYLKKILGGSITQGGSPENARDLYYELWLAALLSEAGFTVHLREPDIVIEGNGLAQPIGIACKYPASEKKLHDNISKGYSQLAAHDLKGFVAIGFDQLLLEITGLNTANFIDFRRSERHPQELMQSTVDQAATALVEQRPELYPSEVPLNEVLVTASLGGIYGMPAGLNFVGALTFKKTPDCQFAADLQLIVDRLRSTPAFRHVNVKDTKQ